MANEWLPFALACIPGVFALGAAAYAERAARRARADSDQAVRIRELEARNAEKKHATYRPMIDMMSRNMTASETGASEDVQANLVNFGAWIVIWGSDEAIRAYHNLMQASFADAPPLIFVRLQAEFILAARRDLGYAETDLTKAEILAIRITDVYSRESGVSDVLTKDFDELCRSVGWVPPWRSAPAWAAEPS